MRETIIERTGGEKMCGYGYMCACVSVRMNNGYARAGADIYVYRAYMPGKLGDGDKGGGSSCGFDVRRAEVCEGMGCCC